MWRSVGDALEARQEEFVRLLTTEQGKARAGAEGEIGGSVAWLRGIAQQSLPDEVISSSGDDSIITRRTPIGVIGRITPRDFPLLLAVWKIAPALVAGNTMVLKPSPYSPLCTLRFGELVRDILPPGVLNILAGGDALGQWLTEHPAIGRIAFTGSTETGRKIMASAAGNLKRLTLELDGDDPGIVMPDVDPKAIAKDLFWGAFAHSAQFCVACKRLYVHEDVYDDVARELVAYAKTVKVVDGLEAGVELGPIQNKMQFDKVSNLLEDSKQQRHKFLLGGADGRQGLLHPRHDRRQPARGLARRGRGGLRPGAAAAQLARPRRRGRAREPHAVRPGHLGVEQGPEGGRRGGRAHRGGDGVDQPQARLRAEHRLRGHKQSGVCVESSLHGLAEYTTAQTIMQKKLLARGEGPVRRAQDGARAFL